MIGGGDTALEEALFLTNFAKKVTVVHRRDELRASAIMQQRGFDNPKIDFAWNRVVQRYLGDENGNLTGLELKDTQDGSRHELKASGCFVAIGHVPNTQFLGGQLELDQGGGGLRRRGRSGPCLAAGRHRRRDRLHGRPRGRALVGRQGPLGGGRARGIVREVPSRL